MRYDVDQSSRHWEKDWRFKSFPERFVYKCCGARANELACVVWKHVPGGDSDLSSSDGEEEDEDEDKDEAEDGDDE